jgi:hypothetical protein
LLKKDRFYNAVFLCAGTVVPSYYSKKRKADEGLEGISFSMSEVMLGLTINVLAV